MTTPLPGKKAISKFLRQSKPVRRGSFLSTGIERLDEILGGGLPRGEMSEMVGSFSSGKTSLLFSVLARAGACGEVAAYIDAFNALDPVFAESAGVDLKRLLWVRCDGSAPQRIAKALKAADVLVRSKGFAVVALDLENVGGAGGGFSGIPRSSWFRLKQTLRGTPTALILLGERARSGSAASVVLGFQRSRARWRPPNSGVRRKNKSQVFVPGFGSDSVDPREQNRRHSRDSVEDPPSPRLRRTGLATEDRSKMARRRDANPKTQDAPPSHARALRGIASEARLLRGKKHGHVTIYCDF